MYDACKMSMDRPFSPPPPLPLSPLPFNVRGMTSDVPYPWTSVQQLLYIQTSMPYHVFHDVYAFQPSPTLVMGKSLFEYSNLCFSV